MKKEGELGVADKRKKGKEVLYTYLEYIATCGLVVGHMCVKSDPT
jgi:hypothetical protein